MDSAIPTLTTIDEAETIAMQGDNGLLARKIADHRSEQSFNDTLAMDTEKDIPVSESVWRELRVDELLEYITTTTPSAIDPRTLRECANHLDWLNRQ